MKTGNLLTICSVVILAFFIVSAVGIREQKKEKKSKTIVESNHFESTTQKSANYNITNIKIGKPLVLLLKKDQKKSNLISDFEISLQSKEIKVNCDFKKITDLCILENTQDDKVNMIIQCKVLPCKVSWVIYQPEIKSPAPNQIALNLFTLNESSRHLIGEISCNDPSVDSLDKDVTIYSDSPYRRVYKDNIIYVLFNNQQKGYVFVDIGKKSMACSQMSFKQAPLNLQPSQNITTDFVLKESSAIYQIDSIPKNDFRFECFATRLDTIEQLKSSMSITLVGIKGSQRKEIAKHDLMVTAARANEFTVAFKKIEADYEKLEAKFDVSTNQIVLLKSRLIVEDVQLLQLGQSLFFNLKKDEKINIKIVGNSAFEDNQTTYIIPKRNDEVSLSKSSCAAKQDCEVTITATSDTQNMILVNSMLTNATSIDASGKGLYEFQQIQFIPINKSQKHKITVGEHVFFRKQLKKGQNIQVHINTPNALMYAACQSQCQVPDQRCRQRTGNFHHPFIFEAKDNCNFLINVQGLQNTVFQLTILQDQQFISLQDGTPFSYTMDSKQERVDFKIKLQEKADVSFNLISPLNSLKLLVSNSKNNLPDEDNSQQSTDGYILIEKDLVKGLQFVVSVIKLKQFQSFFTHFTLVVSTKHQKLRLEPTVTNYETLVASSYRDFIFEFDPSQSYILSFYAHNLKDKKIQLQVKISDQEKKWQKAEAMMINQQADYFDLDELSDDLCQQEGVLSCEIFLRITNKMDIEVDFTIILLTKNAIVQLKDGIWQAFPQTYLTSTTNFYFYPRHENQNIFISYNTAVNHVRPAYRLWKYDQDEINPIQWPFPKEIQEKESLNAHYKYHNYISIDHKQMKEKCWPNCVLLISLYVNFQALIKQNINYSNFEGSYFQLMVSNNHAELPQKQKMSLTLGKNEDKRIMIDLKYAISKQTITFFTNTIIGQCPILANVYSQSTSTCPTNQQQADFLITSGEDVLTLQFIKEKLKKKGMEDDKNLYLCLNIHSDTSCKISIQYSTESQGFKKIQADSFEEIDLSNNQTKYYQIDTITKQYAKITRLSGFPFVLIKKCNKGQHKKCMQDFKSDPEKGKQIVVKTQSLEEDFCDECIVLFKFSSVQPSRLNLHLQSGYSDLQIKENTILSDFANQGQTNKYLIHANAKQDLIVNIHIQQGEVEVQLTNLKNINLNKKSDAKNKILHFVVKTPKEGEVESNSALINPLALSSDLMIYHVTIKSLNASKATTYTISYSSGKREVYLQDGVIFDYMLEPNKVSTFYYFNQIANNHVFYSLSMANATTLNQLKIKSYYLEDPHDVATKTEITLEKPPITKKTANPTILFSLPQYNFFMFQLTNPTSKQQKISMGINHQQVILLPFDHQFPFQLHKKEDINILVDVNIPGYLDVSIRKCDSTEPYFAYSFDYDGFIKGQFMYSATLNEQASSHFTIKANRIGTLYINLKANEQQTSTISLKVVHTEQRQKSTKFKAGKRGVLTYELTGDKMAKVTIPAAECDKSPCKGVTYYYLSSTDEQLVYTQLICSSSFFSTAGFNSSSPLPITKVQGKQANNSIVFDYKMGGQTVFLGVKAVSSTGEEVYYQPTEVASLYGKWLQSSLLQRCLMVFIVFLLVCVCMIFVRKASRKGYKPLEES